MKKNQGRRYKMSIVDLISEFNGLEKLFKKTAKKDSKKQEQSLLKKAFDNLRRKGAIVTDIPADNPFVWWEIIISADGRSLEKYYGPTPRPCYFFSKNPKRTKNILLKVHGNLSRRIEKQQQELKAINETLKKLKKS